MTSSRPLLTEVNRHLVCGVCAGYFIDAYTVTLCMHSFCRTCLIKHMEQRLACPKCLVQIPSATITHTVKRDVMLQQLVYKMVPGLFLSEMTRRRDYYNDRLDSGEKVAVKNSDVTDDLHVITDDDKISVCLIHSSGFPVARKKRGRRPRLRDRSARLRCADVAVTSTRDVRYLLCPATVTVALLKRFVRRKFDLGENLEIEMFISDECMRDSYTLTDVAYISEWKREEPLKLCYLVYDTTEMAREMPRILEKIAEAPKETSQQIIPKPKRRPGRPPKNKGTVKSILEKQTPVVASAPERETVAMDTICDDITAISDVRMGDTSRVNTNVPVSAPRTSCTNNVTISAAEMEVAMEIQIGDNETQGNSLDASVEVVEPNGSSSKSVVDVANEMVPVSDGVHTDNVTLDNTVINTAVQPPSTDITSDTSLQPEGATISESQTQCLLNPSLVQPTLHVVPDETNLPLQNTDVLFNANGPTLDNNGVIILENESETISSCDLASENAAHSSQGFNNVQTIANNSTVSRNTRSWTSAKKAPPGGENSVIELSSSGDDEDSSYAKTIDIIENVENAHFALRNVVCIDADEPQVIEVKERSLSKDMSLSARLRKSSPDITPSGGGSAGEVVNIIIGDTRDTSSPTAGRKASVLSDASGASSQGKIPQSANVAKHQTLATLLAAPVSAPSVDSIVNIQRLNQSMTSIPQSCSKSVTSATSRTTSSSVLATSNSVTFSSSFSLYVNTVTSTCCVSDTVTTCQSYPASVTACSRNQETSTSNIAICQTTLATSHAHPITAPRCSRLTESRITNSEPLFTASEPRITQSESRITQPESRITQSEPRFTQSEQLITQPKPCVTQLEPRITLSELRVTQPEPRVTQPEPRVTQAEPRSERSKTIALPKSAQVLTETRIAYTEPRATRAEVQNARTETRAALSAANVTLPPGYIAIPDDFTRSILSPRRRKTVKPNSETLNVSPRLSPKTNVTNKETTDDVTRTVASSTVLDATPEPAGPQDELSSEPAGSNNLSSRSNEVTSSASPCLDPTGCHDNSASKADSETKDRSCSPDAASASHVITKATVETQTSYELSELSPSSNAGSSWMSSEDRKSPSSWESSAASSPGDHHSNQSPNKQTPGGAQTCRDARAVKSRERKSSKPVRINRSSRSNNASRVAEAINASPPSTQSATVPVQTPQACPQTPTHIPMAHQNHGNHRNGLEPPPIKRLRQMCSGFEASSPAGPAGSVLRPWMYAASSQPMTLHGMLGAGGVPTRGYSPGYLSRGVPPGPYGPQFPYQETPSSVTPGYDQPLELTTKKSRERKQEELEAEAKRKRAGGASLPSLVRP